MDYKMNDLLVNVLDPDNQGGKVEEEVKEAEQKDQDQEGL